MSKAEYVTGTKVRTIHDPRRVLSSRDFRGLRTRARRLANQAHRDRDLLHKAGLREGGKS